MMLIAAMLGASWRIWDGAGYGKTWVRSLVLLILILSVMYTKFDLLNMTAWPLWLWAVATVVALQRGYEDWALFDIRQITQYWYAAIPLPVLVFTGIMDYQSALIYIVLLIVAGLAHPVATRINRHTRWAEGLVGACLIGGILI